ncbi:MAG: SLBB domain-containing protein [Thermodesulfobacteriota bacterium]|nr:SLBB domain-containing protein [Thermodesulfobacteriota bacterium]
MNLQQSFRTFVLIVIFLFIFGIGESEFIFGEEGDSTLSSSPIIPNQASPTPDEIQKIKEKYLEESKKLDETKKLKKDSKVPEELSEILETQEIEEPSFMELYVRGQMPSDITLNISQFGYDLFENPPSIFAPMEAISISPDYILGPGDEIRITLWGSMEGMYSLIVDRDGNIAVPTVGVLTVAGIRFGELADFIRKEISKYFQKFNISVTLGRLRGIRIFIVGKVKNPGSYVVSSLSTLVNALFAAGGPTKTGSMRAIELRRNGKTIVTFDLYDFILKGDKTKDAKLLSGDVIFIPTIGSLAAIAGNVKVPAIYEFKKGMKLLDLISMAGGLSATAYTHSVQVERVFENKLKRVFEINLSEMKPEENIFLQDGDIVKVFPITLLTDNKIILEGNVFRPGMYEWYPGIGVKDIIQSEKDFLPESVLSFAHIQRFVPPDYHKETLTFSPHKAIILGDDKENLKLFPFDTIVIYSKDEAKTRYEYIDVKIEGEVQAPGTYTLKKGARISNIIEKAGGFTQDAYFKGAFFTRERVKEVQKKRLSELVDKMEGDILADSAKLVEPTIAQEETMIIEGAVKAKKELIEKLQAAKVAGRLVIKLESLDRFKGTEYDIEIEDKDVLKIPRFPREVHILGAVYNPTSVLHRKGEPLKYYLNKVGGPTVEADKSEIFIIKVDGTVMSRKQGGYPMIWWNKQYKKWNFGSFMGTMLDPGDTILVPQKLVKFIWKKEIMDWTSIFYQIAVSAGVVIAAF